MEYKSVPFSVKEISGRSVTGIAAVFGIVDDGHDRIFKGAFKKTLKENKTRIRHLWQHDNWSPPIAVVRDMQEVGAADLSEEARALGATGGLMVSREYLNTERGNEVLEALQKGALNEMSFAYDPIRFDFEESKEDGGLIRNLKDLRLWETSDVNWGMNRHTLASKSFIPYLETGKARLDMPWSEPKLSDFTESPWDTLPDEEKSRIAQHFAWADEMPPTSFESLKFPHHLPSKVGVGEVVWAGLKQATGIFLTDRKFEQASGKARVYAHLAQHYQQFGNEPPDLKLSQLVFTLGDTLELLRLPNGQVKTLTEILTTLEQQLIAAEPLTQEVALTESVLRRLKFAELDSI